MRLFSTILFVVIFILGCGNMETEQAMMEEPDISSLTAVTEARLMATEGGQLLLRAINAHGGLDAWHNAETSSYVWGFEGGMKGKMVAHNRTRQVYHDIMFMGDEAAPDAQMAWDGTNAWIYPDSLPTSPRFMATTGYYFQSIPFILADPGVRYEVLTPALLDSVEHQIVRATFDDGVGDAPGDHYTLYINPETHMVNAILYRSTYGRGRPEISEDMLQTLLYYEDYVTVDGLTVPTQFEGYGFSGGSKGEKYYEAASSEHSYTQPFDESRLVMPEGGRVDPMPSSE
ncbi:MAG: hypothetical protein OXE92_10595 [Bacteroidetes bacterium]|nr:hypothetical protein [Bacteroidota bacterium]